MRDSREDLLASGPIPIPSWQPEFPRSESVRKGFEEGQNLESLFVYRRIRDEFGATQFLRFARERALQPWLFHPILATERECRMGEVSTHALGPKEQGN